MTKEHEQEKIVSIEDRIPKLKAKRKKKANRRLLFYLTIFFLLITIIIYLQSPLSNIQEIEVSGNELISDAEIIERSQLTTEDNIWNVSLKNVSAKIAEHPLIEKVEVSRKLPQTIKISILEQKVVGYVEKDATLYPLAADGVMIPYADLVVYGSAPILTNFSEEEFLVRLANELANTPEHITNMISEIVWKPTDKNKYKIELYMDDGFIVLTTIRDFANKIKAYPSIVSQLDPNKTAIVHMDVGIYVEQRKD